jgi:hypothetical protein
MVSSIQIIIPAFWIEHQGKNGNEHNFINSVNQQTVVLAFLFNGIR